MIQINPYKKDVYVAMLSTIAEKKEDTKLSLYVVIKDILESNYKTLPQDRKWVFYTEGKKIVV